MRIGNPDRLLSRLVPIGILTLGVGLPTHAEPPRKALGQAPRWQFRQTGGAAGPARSLAQERCLGVTSPPTPCGPARSTVAASKNEPRAAKAPSSPPATDEQFLRRLRLDLDRETPEEPPRKSRSSSPTKERPDKRDRWVDRLLGDDDYARHWARFWREAITAVEGTFGDAHVPEVRRLARRADQGRPDLGRDRPRPGHGRGPAPEEGR